MKTATIFTILAIAAGVSAAPVAEEKQQQGKIFPNDPDISPGQPYWSEWAITTELMNKVDTLPECTLPKVQPTYSYKYYFSQYDISGCSGPKYPCITMMKAQGDEYYIPYFTWTTFANTGTFKKPVWTMNFWFNYNQTSTFKVGDSIVCDGKKTTRQVDQCMLTPKALVEYNIDMIFDIECSRDAKTGYLNLRISQTDSNDYTFNLHEIVEWQPYTSIVKPETTVEYKSVASTIPPRNEVEKPQGFSDSW
jgi:hypothetical protein